MVKMIHKVSVVIPTINLDLLRECVSYMDANAGYPVDELIIVADNPTDMMYNMLIHFCRDRDAKLIINPKKVGIVRSFNLGMKNATNDLIVENAEDLWGLKNYLKILVEQITANPNFGTATVVQSNHPEYTHTQNLCINTRSMLEKLNYYDEIYSPGWYEDTDFVAKQLANGYIPHSIKEARAYHVPHTNKFNNDIIDSHGRIFFERWQVPEWNWLNMPSHSIKDKCTCKVDDVAKKVCGVDSVFLKQRYDKILR